jgi:hypothetical protein
LFSCNSQRKKEKFDFDLFEEEFKILMRQNFLLEVSKQFTVKVSIDFDEYFMKTRKQIHFSKRQKKVNLLPRVMS